MLLNGAAIDLSNTCTVEHKAVSGEHDRDVSVEGLRFLHFASVVVLSILAWVAFALAAISIVWWAVVLLRVGRMMRSGLSLRPGLQGQVDSSQSVAIVIPAHNEERVLGRCLDAALAQDWPNLSVIVALDRCTDVSEAIAIDRAQRDPRLKIVRIEACPPTWAGKCNAARMGAEQSTADWLLFLDADTTASPKLVRALVAQSDRQDIALLSLLTDLDCSSWFERVSQPAASMALLQIYPPERVNRDTNNRPFANGQCLMFRREWYDRIGGHSAVKDDLLEDLAFAWRVDQQGGRVRVLQADGLLSCSMYGDWKAFRRGWTRIFLEACGRRPATLGRYALRQECLGIAPPFAMVGAITLGALTGLTPVFIAGLLLVLLQFTALGVVYRIAGQPWWCTALFPLGCLEVARAFRRARRLLLNGEPVRWGGRDYVLEPR